MKKMLWSMLALSGLVLAMQPAVVMASDTGGENPAVEEPYDGGEGGQSYDSYDAGGEMMPDDGGEPVDEQSAAGDSGSSDVAQ